jgi:HlyD family secretion protein
MRPSARVLVSLALIVSVVGLWWYLTRPKPVLVRVQPVQRGLVEATVANTRAGTVKACRRARLAPSIGGQIATLDVHEGDRVKAGQLLLELWNQDLKAEVTLAEREAEADAARARAACLNAENAGREAERQVTLSKRKLTSQEAVDRALTSARAGWADCEAAEATARLKVARLAVARANLAKTRLEAPFAGVIAQISGELNEFVTPSPPGIPTPPAVDLIDDSCFYISAPIDEVDAPKVRVGAEARVTLDAFGNHPFPGKVRRIAPYVLDLEKQARTVEVEVNILERPKNAPLLAGYSADVEIIVDRSPNVLRIPTSAVKAEGGVLVLDPSTGLLEAREIQKGLSNWEETEVVSGLKGGELVVLSLDRQGVKAGAPARAEKGQPNP